VCLVVGDSLLVVDAAVQGDVDAEGQESHAASLIHTLLAIDRDLRGQLPTAVSGARSIRPIDILQVGVHPPTEHL
jgi:hypothetical protein